MEEDYFEDDEPVDSCHNCGCNIYASEDDGSGLCDQCQWFIHEANS
jgi:transposase